MSHLKCEKCNATPCGGVVDTKSNKSDWNDWVSYDLYINGAERTTEFENAFFCFKCFPHIKDIYVPDMSIYNEGVNRY